MLLAWSLQQYAATPVDINRVIKLLLVHDLGEIDAGDVMVYADIDWQVQKQRELAGVQRLLALLPALRLLPLLGAGGRTTRGMGNVRVHIEPA